MRCINEMKLQFLSRSANEAFARVSVAAFATQLDPTLDEISEIKTAVSEAVTNSVVHGYKNGLGIVYINVRIYEGGRIVIMVKDKGCGIEDIGQAMEPLYTSSDSGDRAGMGFTIMQSFMDKLKVSSKANGGTRIVMEKQLSLKAKGGV
jgi:stage II sporulation protein AB (anti-sigma F factor)